MSGAPALRVLVVDDEAPARLRLTSLVAGCPSPRAEVVGEAANATRALVWLAAHRCDVVLADIAMPGRDGLQLAAEIGRLPDPPAVVFVTAHTGHALAAFELAAIDYLTKPVRRERLQAALQRAAARRPASAGGADAGVGASASPPLGAARPSTDAPVLVVHEGGRLLRIPVAEVLYLKAELKYVTLRTATSTHLLAEALADLEQRLGDRFLRVHRNALVAREAIRAIERRSEPEPRTAAAARSTMEPAAADDEASAHGAGGDALRRRASHCDVDGGWAVLVHPLGEWLAVSRRQAPAVREAILEKRRD